MPQKPLSILTKCFRLFSSINRNDLAKLTASRLPRDSGYSIEYWNTGEHISISDKLMGANARARKTAYAVSSIKYNNKTTESANVLPKVIYNPLTAAARARRDIDVARNFFAALARRGEVRLVEVDAPKIVTIVSQPSPPLKTKKPVVAIQVESEQQKQQQVDIQENDNEEDDWETYADNLDEVASGREILRQQIKTS